MGSKLLGRKIAVFASGSGSNFQRLLDVEQEGSAAYSIALLVCDRPQAKVIKRAERAGIPTFIFNPNEYKSKEDYESAILERLQEHGISWIILAGYLRLIGTTLLSTYGGKIINLHPSLLPAFPGLHGIRDAYQYGVKITGVTVHFVDAGLDTGPIIAQEAVYLSENETLESLTEKIHQAEHQLLPEVVNRLVVGMLTLIDKKVVVKDGE